MKTRTVTSLLLLAAAAAAQSTIVPSAVATAKPTSSQFYSSNVFYSTTSATTPHDCRSQSIYDTNDIAALAAIWTSLQYRRPQSLGNVNNPGTTTATVVLSVSPNAYSAATSTFATNTGPGAITVFNGPLNLPQSNNPPSWPAPWEAPIPFSGPFPYARTMGATLVIDILSVGYTATTPWYVEWTGRDTGRRDSNPNAQSSCRFSNGSYNNAIGYRLPIVGGQWYVNYQGGLPTGLSGVGALGAQGVGGNWGGLTLPIDLGPFGAPGCSWSVSADFTVPISSSTAIYQWPTLNIPNTPALGGAIFYDHAMFIDPPANAWGVVTTWSSKWTIGTNRGAPGAMVYATGASALNPSGTLSLETVPSFQLNP
ncbi:MAG: hypothetical protein IT458_08980 [Planctomycetes bacterium]|nr:hypothetical protein [Planctomycetota bacterium]